MLTAKERRGKCSEEHDIATQKFKRTNVILPRSVVSFFVRHVDGCLRIPRKLFRLQFHDMDPGDVHCLTQQVHTVHRYKISLQNRQSARLFTHIISFPKAFSIPAFEIKLFLLLTPILGDVMEKVAVTFWSFLNLGRKVLIKACLRYVWLYFCVL